jgi:4-hydroxy-2-oxoheptanedioate aldolase
MLQTNLTKQKLAEGKVVFGAIINEHSPNTVELLGRIGFDFAFIDCEHGAMDLNQVENMVRAAEGSGITPIVRIADHNPATLLRVLDRGAQGLIIPHVNTAAQGEAIAKAARYYPEGNRGMGGGRAHDYGIGNYARGETARWINANVLVVPMVEEVEAVNNLDELLRVPGLDVFHCAAGDLGQSMGNAEPAEVRRVMADVVRKVSAAGKYAGIGGNSPNEPHVAAEFIRQGARWITISAQGLLRLGTDLYRTRVDEALAHAT